MSSNSIGRRSQICCNPNFCSKCVQSLKICASELSFFLMALFVATLPGSVFSVMVWIEFLNVTAMLHFRREWIFLYECPNLEAHSYSRLTIPAQLRPLAFDIAGVWTQMDRQAFSVWTVEMRAVMFFGQFCDQFMTFSSMRRLGLAAWPSSLLLSRHL